MVVVYIFYGKSQSNCKWAKLLNVKLKHLDQLIILDTVQ